MKYVNASLEEDDDDDDDLVPEMAKKKIHLLNYTKLIIQNVCLTRTFDVKSE